MGSITSAARFSQPTYAAADVLDGTHEDHRVSCCSGRNTAAVASIFYQWRLPKQYTVAIYLDDVVVPIVIRAHLVIPSVHYGSISGQGEHNILSIISPDSQANLYMVVFSGEVKVLSGEVKVISWRS